MRAGLALIVFVLNVAAILSILRTRPRSGRLLAWLAAVVLLPVLGALGWWAAGRRTAASAAAPHVNGRIE